MIEPKETDIGEPVTYVPGHANGDKAHPDVMLSRVPDYILLKTEEDILQAGDEAFGHEYAGIDGEDMGYPDWYKIPSRHVGSRSMAYVARRPIPLEVRKAMAHIMHIESRDQSENEFDAIIGQWLIQGGET